MAPVGTPLASADAEFQGDSVMFSNSTDHRCTGCGVRGRRGRRGLFRIAPEHGARSSRHRGIVRARRRPTPGLRRSTVRCRKPKPSLRRSVRAAAWRLSGPRRMQRAPARRCRNRRVQPPHQAPRVPRARNRRAAARPLVRIPRRSNVRGPSTPSQSPTSVVSKFAGDRRQRATRRRSTTARRSNRRVHQSRRRRCFDELVVSANSVIGLETRNPDLQRDRAD